LSIGNNSGLGSGELSGELVRTEVRLLSRPLWPSGKRESSDLLEGEKQ